MARNQIKFFWWGKSLKTLVILGLFFQWNSWKLWRLLFNSSYSEDPIGSTNSLWIHEKTLKNEKSILFWLFFHVTIWVKILPCLIWVFPKLSEVEKSKPRKKYLRPRPRKNSNQTWKFFTSYVIWKKFKTKYYCHLLFKHPIILNIQ